MDCKQVMDRMISSWGEDPLPLFSRWEMGVHLLFCSRCTREAEELEAASTILSKDFFPSSPEIEDPVMARLPAFDPAIEETGVPGTLAGEVSLRSWVITGLIILISLGSLFLGMDFIHIARAQGGAFLLPVGLLIGLILSSYGALFIGSHLKELSTRFNLS